jgi:hypothetical protein
MPPWDSSLKRSTAEIEAAHDLLADLLLQRTNIKLDDATAAYMDQAEEVLCWVLGHIPQGADDFDNEFERMLQFWRDVVQEHRHG